MDTAHTNEKKSTHKCEVVDLTYRIHPNADTLSIVDVWGYQVVIKTTDWAGISRAAWCPPDSLVDTTRPEFMFLTADARYAADSSKGGTYARIKAKKLRGVVSYGLLVPVSPDTPLGMDMADTLGLAHYDPPMNTSGGKNGVATGGEVESPPNVYHVKYDVDSFQRYATQMFVEGEPVVVTEKIHGANGRWVYHNNKFYCGSRTEWKKEYTLIPVPSLEDLLVKLNGRSPREGVTVEEHANNILESLKRKNENPPQNMWWKALDGYPAMKQWLMDHPDHVVYGEVYGSVQNLKYGVPDGQVRIGVFDILYQSNWIDPWVARSLGSALPWVPMVHNSYPFNFDELVAMASGNTLVEGAGKQIREGVVVKTLRERNHPHLGRCQLKIVSPEYLEKC